MWQAGRSQVFLVLPLALEHHVFLNVEHVLSLKQICGDAAQICYASFSSEIS
jgi:hypothetical protein